MSRASTEFLNIWFIDRALRNERSGDLHTHVRIDLNTGVQQSGDRHDLCAVT